MLVASFRLPLQLEAARLIRFFSPLPAVPVAFFFLDYIHGVHGLEITKPVSVSFPCFNAFIDVLKETEKRRKAVNVRLPRPDRGGFIAVVNDGLTSGLITQGGLPPRL